MVGDVKPIVGIPYDQKVAEFLSDIGLESSIPLSALSDPAGFARSWGSLDGKKQYYNPSGEGQS